MPSPRHQARSSVMQSLFAYEFHGGDADEILANSLNEKEIPEKETQFAKILLKGLLEKKEDIITKIKEFAQQWPIEKIARVDRAILILGVYEMLYSDIPPIVAINEAIEIAKHFGDTNSPKFVNAVLSAVLKKYCSHRDPKTGQILTS